MGDVLHVFKANSRALLGAGEKRQGKVCATHIVKGQLWGIVHVYNTPNTQGRTPMAKKQQSKQHDEELNEDSSEQESVNALELLKEDHRKVEQLFQSFEEADGRSRQGIADEAFKAIEVHAKIEETLVYPAIREATGEEDLVDEANEEHHVVTLLIKELKKMKASAEGYKAKFKVLSELVKHHIEEEEKEMFPEAENADIDWEELGQEAMSIKERMMSKSSRGQRRAA